jgi:predicted DNA-binding protein with PD1-like motif
VTAIGALNRAKLVFFDWDAKEYRPIPIDEQLEVASLVGDIAIGPDSQPSVHVHAVLGRRDGTAVAGHLLEGHVRPTLEVIVTESPAHLCKVKDMESGLALIRVSTPSTNVMFVYPPTRSLNLIATFTASVHVGP